MSLTVHGKYSLNLSVDNRQVDLLRGTTFESLVIHESIFQALPTMEIIIINSGSLVETYPLIDGSQVDINLTIFNSSVNEEIRFESVLWSYSIQTVTEGYRIHMVCMLSAPDFIEGKIESVNGSSFDVFKTMATRSRMTLVADPSIDKQVWIRAGIRGNVWLNDVINRSWASPNSAFIYAVTRNRELLRYNLTERASRNSKWFFQSNRESNEVAIPENVILYKEPRFNSQSGFLNSSFGYGRQLSNFNLESGITVENKPKSFIKRTSAMNLNESREVPQKYDSLGYNNALNVHDNYFEAYAQNLRLKSFYSSTVELMTDFAKPFRLLDRATLQLYDEASRKTQDVFAGDYFIKNISTIVDPNSVARRCTLVREGINATSGTAGRSK